jgi:hypothetical protein
MSFRHYPRLLPDGADRTLTVNFIEQEEQRRGDIARVQRSQLAKNAEKCQVILDKVMLVLLGIGQGKYGYIRQRLQEML